ncbi:mucin-17-like [Ornithodoros turicata]|uniref:mucin-17-like n=1 Tax=Ornithodoros turicata TaxID=34597 RepID=UPI0031391CFA
MTAARRGKPKLTMAVLMPFVVVFVVGACFLGLHAHRKSPIHHSAAMDPFVAHKQGGMRNEGLLYSSIIKTSATVPSEMPTTWSVTVLPLDRYLNDEPATSTAETTSIATVPAASIFTSPRASKGASTKAIKARSTPVKTTGSTRDTASTARGSRNSIYNAINTTKATSTTANTIGSTADTASAVTVSAASTFTSSQAPKATSTTANTIGSTADTASGVTVSAASTFTSSQAPKGTSATAKTTVTTPTTMVAPTTARTLARTVVATAATASTPITSTFAPTTTPSATAGDTTTSITMLDLDVDITPTPVKPFSAHCNTKLDGISGQVLSPNYPAAYPSYLHRTWCIRAPSNCQVRLNFLDIVQEDSSRCFNDDIAVYDGGSPSDERIGLFCTRKRREVISTGSMIYMTFTYDRNRQVKAFKAEFAAVNCGRTRQLEAVSRMAKFLSFESQKELKNKVDKLWILEAVNGARVSLSFSVFDLDDCCDCEFLDVFDGSSRMSPLIGKYCGKKVPSRLTSSSRTLLLHYYNNGNTSSKGFIANYVAVK